MPKNKINDQERFKCEIDSMSALVFQLKVRSEKITVGLHTPAQTAVSQAVTRQLGTPQLHAYMLHMCVCVCM